MEVVYFKTTNYLYNFCKKHSDLNVYKINYIKLNLEPLKKS